MKYSNYNTILPLSEKLGLVYCGYTDQFVVFQRVLTPLLKTVSANQLTAKAPGLYAELVRGGGIIPDGENEFENLKRLANEAECSPKSYRLILNPTMDCNFRCWYCYESHITGSKMEIEILHRILLMITRIIETQTELEIFDLSFFGGEPLLHYDEIVRPILNHCRQECQRCDVRLSVNFTSNGFLISDNIIAHLTENDELKSFQITLDGNRKKHNKTRFPLRGEGSYDTILTNVRRLLDFGIEVILRINYTASNILSVKDILKDINTINEEKRKLLTISFHRVWQDQRKQKLSDSVVADVVALFRKEFPNVSDAFSMNNLRYPCYADKENEAVINFDGNVFKCTARNFSIENRSGVLTTDGNIIWNKNINSRRMTKLSRRICRNCRILPLCGGGCSQKAIESNGAEICIEGLNNEDMDKVVMQRFYDCQIK
jgi:putative transcriptional regulator